MKIITGLVQRGSAGRFEGVAEEIKPLTVFTKHQGGLLDGITGLQADKRPFKCANYRVRPKRRIDKNVGKGRTKINNPPGQVRS